MFSYTLDIIISALHMAIFFPVLIFYSDGILNAKSSVIMLLSAVCAKMISVFTLVAYRFAMYIPGKFQEFMKEAKNLFIF